MKEKATVILYHGDCPDGFGAAYAAWRVLGDEADYIPCTHGNTEGLLEAVTGKVVYVLDFSFPAEVLEQMRPLVEKLTILDHHKSAKDGLACFHCGPKFSFNFDLEKSGAVLAWEYFNLEDEVPEFIQWIQDRDLWQWKIPHSREYLAVLDCLPFEFKAWQEFHDETSWDETYESSVSQENLQAQGTQLIQKLTQQANNELKSAFELTLGGHTVWAVNSTNKEVVSDVGNALAKKSGTFSVVFRQSAADEMRISLRAAPGFNALPVAQLMGGGGHPAACAFKCTPETWLEILKGKF